MKRAKYAVIWFLDWVVDVRLLGHRWPAFCAWLSRHPWWGCQHDGGSQYEVNIETGDDGVKRMIRGPRKCLDCGAVL